MKKMFAILSLIIVLIISTVYVMLFTPFGNKNVSSFIEKKVNAKGVIDFKFDTFVINMSQLNIAATVDSNSMLTIKGDISPLKMKFNVDYNVDIQDLSKLEKLIQQKLNGPFKTSGNIGGNKDLLLVKGVADDFGSSLKYDVILKNFSPTNIDFSGKSIQIDKLLYTLNQPKYATGQIDIEAKISNPNINHLAGDIVTDIYNGALNNKVINEAFALKLTTVKLFQAKINTTLKPKVVENKIDFYTSFANIFVQNAALNLENNTLNSDYKVVIEDFNNLYDLSGMKLVGNLEVDGIITKNKDLTVLGNTQTLNGLIDFKLFNDDFSANVKSIDVLALTKMLTYPSVFDSKANATVKYNLLTQSGKATAQLSNGVFVKNKFSYLVNTLAKFDLTKEVYKSVDINSDIDKKIIQSVVAMKSESTQIDVPQSRLDMESKTIDALVKLNIKGAKVDAKIKGEMNAPDISIDANDLLKQKAKDKLEEQLKEKLNDKNLGGALDRLKKFF